VTCLKHESVLSRAGRRAVEPCQSDFRGRCRGRTLQERLEKSGLKTRE
jgi:hypothetical protein